MFKNIAESITNIGTNKTARSLMNVANKINEANSEDLPLFFDEMTQILATNNNQNLLKLSDLTTLLSLDEAIYPIYQKISREFLLNNKEYLKLLGPILKFWSELIRAYQLCQRQYQAQLDKKTISIDLKQASFLALRHQMSLIKWDALRHTKSNNEKWNSVFFGYQFIEEHKFNTEDMTSYRGRTPVNPETLMIRLGMFSLSPTDALTRKEIEALDILLNSLFKGITLSNKPFRSKFQYFFDLSSPIPPQRVVELNDSSSRRYWNGEQALNEIGDVLFNFDKGLSKKLTSTFPTLSEKDWYQLLEKLSFAWSTHGGKAVRKAQRITVQEWSLLSINLPNAIVASQNKHLIKKINTSSSIFDKSSIGLGLIYTGPDKKLIDLKGVVLIQSSEINNTIATIKRMQHLPDGGTLIGVQKLGENTITIEINEVDNPKSYQALFVSQQYSSSQIRFLLLAPELAVIGKKLFLNNSNQKFMISITQILGDFLDCKQVSFDVPQEP